MALLNEEELLALFHGDVDLDQLGSVLDRLEQCPDSAGRLKVLVSLGANREEALEALRLAADGDAIIPRPSGIQFGLRLAASIAFITIVILWLLSLLRS